MAQKQIPFQSVCDLVFKRDLLPAVYRWVSALSPEELERFSRIFPPIARGITSPDSRPDPTPGGAQAPSSHYTMPEWRLFRGERGSTKTDLSPEALLARATSSHLTYGAFDDDQMRACRAVPIRTRASDKSQINTTERSAAYMARWSERMLNTTYRNDICRAGFSRTLRDQTADQQIIIYSKGVLGPEAMETAKGLIDKDAGWTRDFRELCRSLSESVDGTAYRSFFTTIKTSAPPTFVHPRWADPVPVSVGLERPAETFWQSTQRRDFVPVAKPEETFKAVDQHRACYTRPFDLHPLTEKTTTTIREGYVDHIATKDDHPEYFMDMQVRIPRGSGAVGAVVGSKAVDE
jgi:hypothetical protein